MPKDGHLALVPLESEEVEDEGVDDLVREGVLLVESVGAGAALGCSPSQACRNGVHRFVKSSLPESPMRPALHVESQRESKVRRERLGLASQSGNRRPLKKAIWTRSRVRSTTRRFSSKRSAKKSARPANSRSIPSARPALHVESQRESKVRRERLGLASQSGNRRPLKDLCIQSGPEAESEVLQGDSPRKGPRRNRRDRQTLGVRRERLGLASQSGNRRPLKKAAGLYMAFLSAM
jgi:hypothetical protein